MSSKSETLLQATDLFYRHPNSRSGQPGGSEGASAVFQLRLDQLEVRVGEVLAFCGPSGSGKSTLMGILAGLCRPTSGQVLWATQGGYLDIHAQTAKKWRQLRSEIGYVSQDPRESLNDRRTVLDIVMDPLRIHQMAGKRDCESSPGWLDGFARGRFSPGVRRSRQRSALSVLETVGIPAELAARTPQKLSGGQRQRIALARALVTGPRMLVLDEPTSSLDVSVQASITRLLVSLRQHNRGQTHLLVTHDLSLASQLADRIAVLDQGQIVELGTAEQILRSPQALMTQRLLEIARQWS